MVIVAEIIIGSIVAAILFGVVGSGAILGTAIVLGVFWLIWHFCS